MEKSATLKELATALSLFQGEVEPIIKNSDNPFYKSKYADISGIFEVIREPLLKHGLSITQFPSGQYGLTTLLLHKSGEFIQDTFSMKPVKDDPQGAGSVITYQRRYAICAVLGLSTDDDDANHASGLNGKTETRTEPNDLPWMTEKQFKQALERIADGDTTVLDQAKKTLKIRRDYQTKLQEAIELLTQP